MSSQAPVRSRQSYRHEAFFWREPDDFSEAMADFLLEGLDAGEQVMAATTMEHLGWLRDALGGAADHVRWVDMAELGRNPARIIPAWQEFVYARPDPWQPARGIGEPIWPGRRTEELLECQLHEALLNVAVDPDTPFWLICPYDATTLAPDVLEEAHRSHPVIVEADSHRGSEHYAGRSHVDALFGADLAEPDEEPRTATFTTRSVPRLARYLKLELYVAGLPLARAEHIAGAAELLALGSLQRGSHEAVVHVWSDAGSVTCEVADDVPLDDPLVGRRVPTDEHEGLWLANQACDLVQLRSTTAGSTVRILTWR